MSTKKATKRALLTSVLAICLCLVMLIGSTFAWFTDTASTSVNQIQSGKLDVSLEMKDTAGNWVTAEGKTLSWVQADGTTTNLVDGKSILWEPGCTYELQPIRISNNGNLKLKYKVAITGITGDTGLNKAIVWTIGNDGVPITTGGNEYKLDAKTNDAVDFDILNISGHMKEDAGNEYQGLHIDGIGITVYATQVEGEYDSNSNDYDKNATYPTEIVSAIENAAMTAVKGENDTVTEYTYTNTDATVTATVPAEAVAKDEDGTAKVPTITVKPTTVDETASLAIKGDGKDAIAYDISVVPLAKSNDKPITVEIYVGKNLTGVQVYHNGEPMTENSGFTYSAETGFVTITTTSFSTFSIAFNAPVAAVNGTACYTLADAIAAAKSGDTVVLTMDTNEDVTIDKDITLDLNGKTLTNTNAGKATISVTDGTVTVKNGTVTGGTSYYNIEVKKDSGANLTLENVTATAGNTGSSMIDNWGTLAITSGTYTGGLDVVKSEEGSVLNINGGTFTLNYAQKWKFNAVILVYGDTTISGGEFIQNAKVTSAYPQVVVTGVVDGYTATTKITGGTFTNNFNGTRSGIFWALGDATSDNFAVSGGTFNKKISANYCAEGYAPASNGDGTYSVVKAQ